MGGEPPPDERIPWWAQCCWRLYAQVMFWVRDRHELKRQGFRYNRATRSWETPVKGQRQ